MKTPKMYAPCTIKFSSLRNGLGESLGVLYDIDTEVVRRCRRVVCHDGNWKWQIIDLIDLATWDYYAFNDQEILDEIGFCLDDVEIIKIG